MVLHTIAATPEATAASLVLQERGLAGVDIVLVKHLMSPDSPFARKTLGDAKAILGTYFLRAEGLRSFIETLEEYADIIDQYKDHLEFFLGWEDPEFREHSLRTFYQSQIGRKVINLGSLDLKLFIEDCHDNHAAIQRITRDWESANGSLKLWGIELEILLGDTGVWKRVHDFETAIKFESWLYVTYIGPTLHKLQNPVAAA
jgi:hypothetical protein